MENVQQPYVFECQVTRKLNYLIYLPRDYEQSKRWPLLLFLHGAGERGKDVERIKRHGLPRLINEGQEFPFIVVSPQCRRDEWWQTDILAKLVDEIVSRYAVDSERIYVTGMSMGGYGTWALAIKNPQRFAAIAPICGGGDPDRVCAIQHIPTWVFHGAKDNIVRLQESEDMVKALEACGGNVQFTVYPEADHDSWTETYANPQLYTWLLEQRRV